MAGVALVPNSSVVCIARARTMASGLLMACCIEGSAGGPISESMMVASIFSSRVLLALRSWTTAGMAQAAFVPETLKARTAQAAR